MGSNSLFQFLKKDELVSTALLLSLILSAIFYQVVWGDRTLMFSARSMASVMPYGAYNPSIPVKIELPIRSPDPAAPAWQTDPWVMFLHNQVLKEHVFPLWNPFNGLGMPFLANMQSQPFFLPVWLPSLFPTPLAVDLFDLSRMVIAGLFTFAFLRLFLVRTAGIVGAIAYMLTGYIVLYLNMPEISVAASAPFVFYAFERVLRRANPRTIAVSAIASCANLYGGMPESTALVMTLAGIYFLVRLIAIPRKPSAKLKTFGALALGCALGLCLAAPQVLPFIEYMRQSFNIHDPALGVPICGAMTDGSTWWPTVMYYMFPFDLGGSTFLGQQPFPLPVRGFAGIIVTFLAFIAASILFRKFGERHPREKMILHLVSFFLCTTVFFILKRFGCPLVNWVGLLPLMEMINFPKYGEPLIGFSMAVLAAAGTHLIFRRQARLVDLCAAFLTLSLPFAIWKFQEHPAQFASSQHAGAYYYNVFVFILVMLSTTGLLAVYLAPTLRSRFPQLNWDQFTKLIGRCFTPVIVVILVLELTIVSIGPILHRNKLPSRQCNPYNGAPYIALLQSKSPSLDRVMGLDAFLFPNWSTAYGLYDIRALDAMYVGRYLPFIRNFLLGNPEPPQTFEDTNCSSRFNGIEKKMQYPTELTPDSLLYRLWVLSSVKYVITEPFSQRLTPQMIEIAKQNASKISDFFGPRDDFFAVDGKRLSVIYQFPLGKNFDESKIQFNTTVPSNRPVLSFRVGLNSNIPARSDGAGAYLRLLDGKEPSMLFSKVLDATHGSDFPLTQIDLSKYAGKSVTLEFSVDAGPTKLPMNDWVGWADLRFVDRIGDTSTYWPGDNSCRFHPIYSGECTIFENPKTLPRASVFGKVTLVSKGEDALQRLRQADFDVLKEVVIEETKLLQADRQQLSQLVQTNGDAAQSQNITRYSAQEVDIEVDSTGGLLMLNDTMYPGWKALVDGKEVPIHYSDYLFRGVVVSPGKHIVQFRYEPLSFLFGIALFVASAISVAFLSTKRRSVRTAGATRLEVDSP